MQSEPRVLTNMAFWQSQRWLAATRSIYDLTARGADPAFMPWWKEAWTLFRQRRDADVILTLGVRTSMAYGALCLLTASPSKQIMCEVFIDAPRSSHPLWAIKTALYKCIARRAVGILTNSLTEVKTIAERYGLPADRIRYVPLNVNASALQRSKRDEGFILSAGRTQRDYATLLAAAARIDRPFVVICGPHDVDGLAVPPNVNVLREASRETYLDHLDRCSLVALPLLPTERATGQVVLLEAMAKGKPVITTRVAGTVDLVRDGENGLLVNPGDADGLVKSIKSLLDDPARAARLAGAGVLLVKTEASAELHAARKLAAIAELWRSARA